MPEVRKTLTAEMLRLGQLTLTSGNARDLGMPGHSEEVVLIYRDEEVPGNWNSRTRQIAGDQFRVFLQAVGREGLICRVLSTPDQGRIGLDFMESAQTVLVDREPTAPPEEQPRRRRRTRMFERFRNRHDDDFKWFGPIGLHEPTLDSFVETLSAGGWDARDRFELRIEGERLAAVNSFEELISLGLVNVERMPHQINAAVRVLSRLHGRAFLCDEVGLGKTIEAGLIAKELIVRGMVHRILVICPASLREQWADEMKRKFEENFSVAESSRHSFDDDRLITSPQLGISNFDVLTRKPWDLVIVDEIHKFSGAGAFQSQRLVRKLSGDARYVLFLTATPVQNSLMELYRLVELLRPGTLGTEREFQRRYLDPDDKRTPIDEVALRRLLANVMIRTTRAQAGFDNVEREVIDVPIEFSNEEREAYESTLAILRNELSSPGDYMRRQILSQRMTASYRSLLKSLRRMAASHPNPDVRQALLSLCDRFERLVTEGRTTARQQKLIELCRAWTNDRSKGKVLVFAQAYETLEDLARLLQLEGLSTCVYHGGLSGSKRGEAVRRFQNEAQVMVSTDAGAEGLNLQFANCVINFDLPWNPMRIEQRIGRVHRLKQDRTVYVANLYAADTIDERILTILRSKLRMFELLFGQLTTVLGSLRNTFERLVIEQVTGATDEADQDRRLDDLGEEIGETRDGTEDELRAGGHLTWLSGSGPDSGPTEASELLPEDAGPQGESEQQAEEFVRKYLALIGCEIVHTDERFITVVLNAELAERFDVPELHLAFSPPALNMHPNAELCVVGSELFDEFMGAIAETGDLLCEVPDGYDELPQVGVVAADTGIQFVDRTVLGPKLGPIEATWRATDDAAIAGDEIITVTLEGAEEQREDITYRALDSGESLPASFPTPKKLISGLEQPSVEQLGVHGEEVQEEANRRSRAGAEHFVDRIRRGLRDLFRRRDHVAGRTEQQRIERAYDDQISNLEAQLEVHQAGAPQVRVKADLLALRLTGNPIIEFRETWADASGSFKITGELDLRTGDRLHYSTDGREISHLTICAGRHPIDLARTEVCPCCSERVCEQCVDRFEFGECDLCGVSVCGKCLSESERQQTKSLCEACKSPERCEELDDSYRLGFRIGGSSTLRVGLREAEFDANDGSLPSTIVPNEDVDDPLRVQLRTYAIAQGLPVSTSAIALPFQTPDLKLGELPEARSITNLESTVGIEEGLPPNLDEAAVAGLSVDDLAEGDVLSEQGSGLRALLDECRTHDIPQPPTLVVSRVAELRTLTLTVEGLQSATTRIQANAEPELVSEELFGFEAPTDDGELGLPIASATAGDLTVQVRRVNHSYLLEVSGSPPVFVAGHPDLDSRTELGWARLVESLDARVWSTDRQPPLFDHRLVNPTRPVCTERNTTSSHVLTGGSGDQPAGPPSAYGMGDENEIENIPAADPHISSVVLQVGGAFPPATEVTVEPAVMVQEQWSDLGETTLSYLVSDHLPLEVPDGVDWVGPEAPLAPVDDGQALTDFEIDWFGQLRPYQEELFDGSGLPAELHAQGLKGRLSSKGDIDVVVLAGRIRREIVTLRRSTGEVTKWQTASDRPLPEQRLALAVFDHLGIAASEVEVEVVDTQHDAVEVPSDAHLITEDSSWLLSASVTLPDGERLPLGVDHMSRTPIGDNPLIVARAGHLLGLETPARLEPLKPIPRLERVFSDLSSSTAPALVLHIHYAKMEIRSWVDATGLHSTAVNPDSASTDPRPWTVGPMPEWAIGEWQNPPRSVLQAELDTVSAVLARQGNFFVLATRSTSGPEWFLLSGDPIEDFIRSSIGAELLRDGQVAKVTAIANPSEFDRPTVTGGRHLAQDSCDPEAIPDDRPGSAEVSVEFVKDLFEGKYLFRTLTVGEATVPLWSPRTAGIAAARALVHAATEQLPDTTQRIAIGFKVTDTWQVSDEPVQVQYTIRPGQTQGLIKCHATGEQLREVTIDRSGHAVGSSEACPYCDTSTCVECVDPVAPCPVCRSLICGECARPAGEGGHNRVCEACYPPNLQPVGWFARWQHRQHLVDASSAYSGHDRRHRVLVANFNGTWTVRVDDSEAAPLSAEAITLLAANVPEMEAD